MTYLKEQRKQSGIVCKHCGYTEHSRLPFRYRMAAMFLLTDTKKSFSIEELRRQSGYKRYQPILGNDP